MVWRWTSGIARYETFDALHEYCWRVASTVGLICVEIFGYTRPESRDYAVNLGIALQLTNIIRDVRVDLERGRVYLPAEDLRRFDVTEPDLRAGRVTEGVRRLLAYQCSRARGYYGRAMQLLPPEDRRSLVAAEIMRRHLPQRPRSDRARGLRRVRRDHPRATPPPRRDCGDDLGAVARRIACRRLTSSSSEQASPG